ncbi:integral membrane protein DUF92-domain-containing protein [Pavlovales sp. CCMP2436]|nr:integral membrane protein DUF92-domain-containing protein [Pavlovales sp. CCMP2436]|mmetsp:Transcript_11151/g.28147  ORF Transcript_11151/g.28147 Transcript_11151/m.28147 type:complete len:309 (+) Transcript_11151:138-1064(+)
MALLRAALASLVLCCAVQSALAMSAVARLPRARGRPLLRAPATCRPHAQSMLLAPAGVVLAGQFAPSLPVALSLNTVLCGAALLKGQKALTPAGLFNAWILGVVLWATMGGSAWLICVIYLVGGTAVTKVGKAKKEALGISEGRGGMRGPENVWGSAATAAICALLTVVLPEQAMLLQLGYVASLATKLSDTFASEIGKAYGRTTYLITTFQLVPKGTEGAISLEGTVAGVGGSLIIALAAYLMTPPMISPLGVGLSLVAAFVACNCESLIGATAQDKVPWLTNEMVNFFNTAIGAVVAIGLQLAFFK